MIKAVFFDIDGTLVPFGRKSIPETTRRSIERLRQNGIKVFIATGRHPEWIVNLGDMEFDGYVATNGSMCLLGDGRTEIYRHEIDREDMERLIPFANSHDIPFVVVPANGGIFVTSENMNLVEASKMLHIPPIPIEKIEKTRDLQVVQMMAFASPEVIVDTRLFQDVLKHCVPTSWNPLFADIVPIGGSKAVGIDRMIEYFGIDLSETMAFGDGDNDISMLKHCGIGVAMGQAPASVKDSADYVTASVDDDGVTKALAHFNLI